MSLIRSYTGTTSAMAAPDLHEQAITISIQTGSEANNYDQVIQLEGELTISPNSRAIILFAHGSGSGRHSTRNQFIARVLNSTGLATLLVDLLTNEEKEIDATTRQFRFDIPLLASRFLAITNWITRYPDTQDLRIGYFGSSTGSAAALIAASKLDIVKAIVSRGGRPDLAEDVLQDVITPTLFIVGGDDTPVIGMNKRAMKKLERAHAKELAIIPGAQHVFEEPGKMEQVADLASRWFESYLLDGRQFENKYQAKGIGLLSYFKKRSLRIKFKDRAAAGNILASSLKKYKGKDVTVIGIPRGGAIIADVIAKKLSANFDLIVARKLRAPDNSENSMGAIVYDQDGAYIDEFLVRSLNVSDEYIQQEKLIQRKEVERRLALYRPTQKEYDIKNKVVILADDGAATGSTIIAAARWIRKQGAKRLIIAIPVAPRHVANLLRNEADQVEISRRPSDFKTVEQFYQDYDEVRDEQIVNLAMSR